MDNANIIIIDQTIREGMQHRGIVFSLAQRKKIAAFQEKIKVDICQAGYPPAHVSEQESVVQLREFAENQGYRLRIAGMGRAVVKDAALLIKTGIKDFHLHAYLPGKSSAQDKQLFFSDLEQCITAIRDKVPDAVISLAMLDIGRTDPAFIEDISGILIHQLKIDILSLPDTSGIISPNTIYDLISPAVVKAMETRTRISVHCHNDMGMAGANTIMGVTAGATAVEASALGIGERNGIADLFTTCKMLKDQGFLMNLDTRNIDTFTAYYEYISHICKTQTGEALLTYNTPFFGDGVNTHVAGTHGRDPFGINREEKFFLNTLCGRRLVKKYLDLHKIPYSQASIPAVTDAVKSLSASLNRRVKKAEIQALAEKMGGRI